MQLEFWIAWNDGSVPWHGKTRLASLIFGFVATNLENGREVWLQQGSLLEAVRASAALPGLLTPVNWNGHWLVDGGLVKLVPVSVCRALGATRVINKVTLALPLDRGGRIYGR